MAKQKQNLPDGTTIIDERLRYALKLTHEEYAFAYAIYLHNRKFKTGFMPLIKYFTDIGLVEDEVFIIGKSLKNKGIIIRDVHKKRWTTAPAWNINFDEETQFETLWGINRRGNKSEAKINFMKMRSLVSFNQLVLKLQEYVSAQNDPKYIMHLKRWLDPKFKRWEDEVENRNQQESVGTHDESITFK